jgi:hypothetical protein
MFLLSFLCFIFPNKLALLTRGIYLMLSPNLKVNLGQRGFPVTAASAGPAGSMVNTGLPVGGWGKEWRGLRCIGGSFSHVCF